MRPELETESDVLKLIDQIENDQPGIEAMLQDE